MTIELLVPIVIGVVEAIKRSGTVNIKYIPLVAIAVGTLAGLVNGGNNFESLISGITIGLISAGLWDFAKSSIAAGKEAIKQPKL